MAKVGLSYTLRLCLRHPDIIILQSSIGSIKCRSLSVCLSVAYGALSITNTNVLWIRNCRQNCISMHTLRQVLVKFLISFSSV